MGFALGASPTLILGLNGAMGLDRHWRSTGLILIAGMSAVGGSVGLVAALVFRLIAVRAVAADIAGRWRIMPVRADFCLGGPGLIRRPSRYLRSSAILRRPRRAHDRVRCLVRPPRLRVLRGGRSLRFHNQRPWRSETPSRLQGFSRQRSAKPVVLPSPVASWAHNHACRPTPPLSCDWVPHRVWRDASAQVIRAEAGRIVSRPAVWGRSGRDALARYLDDSAASGVRRGLIAGSAFQVTEEHPARSWEARKFKVRVKGQSWFMLGVALGPEDGASFAILTNGAGADLRPIVSCEPVIVPQSKWAEWVAPGRGSALWFPTRDGTFNVEAN